jgi:hypothetical protein
MLRPHSSQPIPEILAMTFNPSFRNGLIAALCSVVMAAGTQAAAPQVKTQAPGFYRTMVGDFEVTALFDGVLELTPKELHSRPTRCRPR